MSIFKIDRLDKRNLHSHNRNSKWEIANLINSLSIPDSVKTGFFLILIITIPLNLTNISCIAKGVFFALMKNYYFFAMSIIFDYNLFITCKQIKA